MQNFPIHTVVTLAEDGTATTRKADTLTDREYAEVLGSLQTVRDNARAHGREPLDVISALEKLGRGCTPSTNGITFALNG